MDLAVLAAIYHDIKVPWHMASFFVVVVVVVERRLGLVGEP